MEEITHFRATPAFYLIFTSTDVHGYLSFYGNTRVRPLAAMPIVKVPVEHRFGVVSLNRAEELLQKQKEKVPTKSTK